SEALLMRGLRTKSRAEVARRRAIFERRPMGEGAAAAGANAAPMAPPKPPAAAEGGRRVWVRRKKPAPEGVAVPAPAAISAAPPQPSAAAAPKPPGAEAPQASAHVRRIMRRGAGTRERAKKPGAESVTESERDSLVSGGSETEGDSLLPAGTGEGGGGAPTLREERRTPAQAEARSPLGPLDDAKPRRESVSVGRDSSYRGVSAKPTQPRRDSGMSPASPATPPRQ
ncbi:MAG TPA: hypothetical protein VJB02_03740, partial [Coxiellaceae bacterium]|nr:hypothetical protein [Coxiellaceae bacterium]